MQATPTKDLHQARVYLELMLLVAVALAAKQEVACLMTI
jgi:hypothetical protein